MVKHIESGISGKNLGFRYLQIIKDLAVRCHVKGIVFTIPNGSIRVIAEGEEINLIDFTEKLRREVNSREIENFYIKWDKQDKDLESFHVVVN